MCSGNIMSTLDFIRNMGKVVLEELDANPRNDEFWEESIQKEAERVIRNQRFNDSIRMTREKYKERFTL